MTTRQQQVVAQQQLHQIAQLAAEYAELANRTDLTALVFQVQLVLDDRHELPG